MEAIAICAVIVNGATVYLFLRHFEARAKAADERERELLNRIQRPEILPLADMGPVIDEIEEPDQYENVGTINTGPDDGDDL